MLRPSTAVASASAAASLLLALSLPQQAQAAYSLTKDYSGTDFFSGWTFYGNYDNLTNGDIIWVNQSDSSDLAYINSAGNAIIKVDNVTTVPYNEKRRSVRIQSEATYPIGSMWVFDFEHVPYGCSVWPAAWSQAQTWPEGGEIDTVEGVNLQAVNQMALHTESGCTAATTTSANPFTGNLTYDNCDHDANGNNGCSVFETNTASYGEAFAKAGGGVWATEFGKDGIKIWFFSRANVPSDLLTSNSSAIPNPSNWGTPSADYTDASCSITDYFAPQHLVLDITACGDYAGAPAIINQTCPLTTDLCYTSFVLDSANFANAYFEIPSIRVYSDPDKAADSAAQTTQTATSAGGASASASKSAGTSSASKSAGTSSASKSAGAEAAAASSGTSAAVQAYSVGGMAQAAALVAGLTAGVWTLL